VETERHKITKGAYAPSDVNQNQPSKKTKTMISYLQHIAVETNIWQENTNHKMVLTKVLF
jgi:hypothetical protein